MRTITYGAAVSLDGFIARADHAVDWLHWSEDVAAISGEYWTSIDTVLMGRKTYEAAGQAGYPDVRNYVFSGSLKASPHPNVELVRDDAVEFVRGLKQTAGKGICVMGGGVLARTLLDASLIDEVGVNIHPVILGSGIPLLPPGEHQIDLELVECRAIKLGCVYARYRIVRGR